MRIAAATIAVTIAAGVVGFVVADHTLPDSRELRKVSVEFLPKGATNVETGKHVGKFHPPGSGTVYGRVLPRSSTPAGADRIFVWGSACGREALPLGAQVEV